MARFWFTVAVVSLIACEYSDGQPLLTGALDTTLGSPETGDGASTAAAASVTGDEPAGDGTGDALADCAAFDLGARVTVQGTVQKGPYTAGAEVLITLLTPSGDPTDQVFAGATVDDLGNYTVHDVPAGPVLVQARGSYYDELADAITVEPLTLRAFGRAAADVPINVNVLTHITTTRTRALFAEGACLEDVHTLAQNELWRIHFGRGPSVDGFRPTRPGIWDSITGPDDLDNAYLLALGAVFMQAAHEGADLQQLLDAIDADNAANPMYSSDVVGPLWAAELTLPAALFNDRLVAHLQGLGQSPEIPNLWRILDQDHDTIPDADDNCPFVWNQGQGDGDGDGIGGSCDCGAVACDCGFQAPDGDDDGYPDACDNCPDVANSQPGQDNTAGTFLSDIDFDGLGNACDTCSNSPDVGATPDDQCCDPRLGESNSGWGGCVKDWWGNIGSYVCDWNGRFRCIKDMSCPLDAAYGQSPCYKYPTAPAGALAPVCDMPECDCDNQKCASRWCTVDGDDECDGDLNVCIPWFHPGEAPPAFDNLGACARTDQGPCAGKVGRECID